MSSEPISQKELDRLRHLSDAGSPGPWSAWVEGRDHTSGDTFIMVGAEGNRGDDMYVSRDSGGADAADLDLVAEARTALPRLLDEIDRLRALLEL
ncbi:hypothetical protein acdb102_27150 [Acidothermaceae bacterium B102]|nr:hypothetical protein acdb102_27150 [Acidothermaceae bacterium B102]